MTLKHIQVSALCLSNHSESLLSACPITVSLCSLAVQSQLVSGCPITVSLCSLAVQSQCVLSVPAVTHSSKLTGDALRLLCKRYSLLSRLVRRVCVCCVSDGFLSSAIC